MSDIEKVKETLKICREKTKLPLATCDGCSLENDDNCIGWLFENSLAIIEQQQAELAELKEANRWIPVSEKLPEEDGRYFCLIHRYIGTKNEYKCQDILMFTHNPPEDGCYGENKFWDYDVEYGYTKDDDVTHWRQLPSIEGIKEAQG